MSDIPDEVLERILAALDEDKRLRLLSNEELVREYLKLGEADDEHHVNEMMNRLWPKWAESEL